MKPRKNPQTTELSLELLERDEDLAAIEPEWRSLLVNSSADGVFMTWEYVMEWWSMFGAENDLKLFVVRDGHGEVCAIAPMMIGTGYTLARKHLRHLTLIGQLHESLTEYQEFIVRPGYEAAVAELLVATIFDRLKKDWDLLNFSVIREGSAVMEAFATSLEKWGYPARQLFVQEAPKVDLGDSWEDFLARLSRNFRKKVKRAEKKFDREFEPELLVAGKDIGVGEALDVLVDLNEQRWGSDARSFQSQGFVEFHEKLAAKFLEKGWLSLLLMRSKGEYVAAQYDFVYGGKVWGFQGGWKPELGDFSTGKVMMAKALRRFLDQGLSEYDFLAGEAEYKASWSDGCRRVYDLELANPGSVRGLAFGVMRNLRMVFFGEQSAAA